MQVETAANGFNQPELSPSGRIFSVHVGLNKRLTDIYRDSIDLGDHRVQLSEAIKIFGFEWENSKVATSLRSVVKTADRWGLFNTSLREDNSGTFLFTREQLMLLWV